MGDPLVNDIAQYFLNKKLGQQLLSGVIRHHDLACLVLFCQGDHNPGPRARSMKVNVVAEADSQSAAFDASGQLDLRHAEGACDVRLVPGILQAITGRGPTWHQMELAIAEAMQPQRGQGRRQRAGPGADVAAEGAADGRARKRAAPGARFEAEPRVRSTRRLIQPDPLPPPLAVAGEAAGAGGDGPSDGAASSSHAVAMAAAPRMSDIAKYDDYDKEQCQMVLAVRDKQLEEQAAEIERLQQKVARVDSSRQYFERRVAKLVQHVGELQREAKEVQDIVCWRPGRYVAPFGGYNLALRRNRGHAAASTAAAMIMGDDTRGHVNDKKQ